MNEQVKPMELFQTFGRAGFAALLCLSLVVWSIAPSATHAPSVFEVMADHTQMIAEHGHSHGVEEDLYWAMHGHSHEAADHDHSQALLAAVEESYPSLGYRDARRLGVTSGGLHRVYLIDRPPRA